MGKRLVCSVTLLLLFGISAQTALAAPLELVSGKIQSQYLVAGQNRDYRVTLAAGQAALLQLQQDQNAITLEQINPSAPSQPVRLTDAGRYARLQWTLIAAHATNWIIRVSPRRTGQPARYQIELLKPHEVRTADSLRAQAETALATAEAQRRTGNAKDIQTALADYQTAITAYNKLPDGCGGQAANVGLARYEMDRGRYANAQAAAEAALRLQCNETGTALALRAIALRSLSSARFYQGDFFAGVQFGQESLALSRRTQDLHSQEWTLGDLAADYSELGETARALQMARTAESLARKLGDQRNALLDQINIASMHLSRGELIPALNGYRQALEPLQTAPDPYLAGLAWTNLGILYDALGNGVDSLHAFNKGIALWTTQHNQPELSAALWNQGFVFLAQNAIKPACAVFQRALQVTESSNLQNDRTHVLEGLGRCAMADRDWPRARDYFDQSLALAQKLGNPTAEIPAQLALGDLESAQRHFAAARTRYEHTYDLARQHDDHDSQVLALAGLARMDRDSGDLDAARGKIERALTLIENQRIRITDPDLRTDFFAAQRPLYGLDIEILMQLHAARPGRDYALLALRAAERARTRSLEDRFAEHALIIHGGLNPKALAAEQAAEEQLRIAAYQVAELPANAPAAQHQALQASLQQSADNFDTAQGALFRTSPRFAELIRPLQFTVADLKTLRPDKDVVILEYWLGKKHSYLWVVGGESVHAYTLPAGAQLSDEADKLLAQLEYQPPAVSAHGIAALAASQSANAHGETALETALGHSLLDPAQTALAQYRTVAIIADGELNRLPFGVLRFGNASTMFGVRHNLVYLPSISTLQLIRDVQRQVRATQALAIIADPVFSPRDPRLTGERVASSNTPVLDAVRSDLGVSNLPLLPFSAREAAAIQRLAGGHPVWLATGFAATRAAVLKTDWSRYTIAHFATHSLLDMTQPELSGIVLSMFKPRGRPVDGFLHVSDLYDLRMPVKLVVLSTCDSAAGPSPGAEGVFSLSRAFFYAGADRVLGSLWPVDDLASARFMDLFYSALLKQHEPAPAALRLAQNEMAADPRYAAPYYWAGYVLQGDWQ